MQRVLLAMDFMSSTKVYQVSEEHQGCVAQRDLNVPKSPLEKGAILMSLPEDEFVPLSLLEEEASSMSNPEVSLMLDSRQGEIITIILDKYSERPGIPHQPRVELME